ncbi:MAG: VOC family protein [Flavobacteriaceae bacterium]|nr:VOC family protein [Eudoraea sp.]NNJ39145.1 VOC family protein [Flavobacteriaceae bacterium]
MATPFAIDFLDHVALRVKDLQVSARWYEKVMGLTPYHVPEWGEYPIFLLAGKTGVALFPASSEDSTLPAATKGPGIDHFAFQVSNENFEKSKAWFSEQEIPYQVRDHHHFLSVYLQDPDGHTVELTTLVGKAADFYKN